MAARRAGQHARETTRRKALRGLLAIAVVLLTGVVVGWAAGFQTWTFIGAELVALLILLAVDRFAAPVVERWSQGATGEEYVGALLEELVPHGWRVVHDVDTGRGNVDHVVIGPAGVFTIETKSHGGRIDVDRIDQRMWAQAYAQSKWVEEAVGAKVTPLLVFSRAYLTRAPAFRKGVSALPARMLVGFLRRRHAALGPAEVERLTAALISR